jgi:hypothetical protein
VHWSWHGSAGAGVGTPEDRGTLASVAGGSLSSGHAWAVGEGGLILHWDGSAWLSEPSNTRSNLRGAWESSAGDVWAVGDFGTILHRAP